MTAKLWKYWPFSWYAEWKAESSRLANEKEWNDVITRAREFEESIHFHYLRTHHVKGFDRFTEMFTETFESYCRARRDEPLKKWKWSK